MYKVNGFTLVELMVVVAIIGTLSWFSVPKYQNYLLKTTVTTQMLSATRGLQAALMEYTSLSGSLPSSFADLSNIGFVDHLGDQYNEASDFSIGAVSGVTVSFPSSGESVIVLGVAFACTSLAVASCSKVAPKALQDLTLEITGTYTEENGSLTFHLDKSSAANAKFKGFLPSL